MKIIIGIVFGVMFSLKVTAQDEWLLKCDSAENCGYMDRAGTIRIPFGKYPVCYTDTFRTYAIVALKNKPGFIGIDKSENELFQVYPFDNGPDYITEGTFRVIKGSKVGFADTTGTIIIRPVYDFTFGFEKGLAIVNIGGHEEKVDPADPNCEYHTWRGGKWGVIDKSGKRLLDIKYDYYWNQTSHKTELIGENERYWIENGEVVNEKE